MATAFSTEISSPRMCWSKKRQLSNLETSASSKKSDTLLPSQNTCPPGGTELPKTCLEADHTITLWIFLHLAALWLSFTLSSLCFLVRLKWTSFRRSHKFWASPSMTTGQMQNGWLTESCSQCQNISEFPYKMSFQGLLLMLSGSWSLCSTTILRRGRSLVKSCHMSFSIQRQV